MDVAALEEIQGGGQCIMPERKTLVRKGAKSQDIESECSATLSLRSPFNLKVFLTDTKNM